VIDVAWRGTPIGICHGRTAAFEGDDLGFPGFSGAHHFIKDFLVEDHEKGPYSHVCAAYDSRLDGSLKG